MSAINVFLDWNKHDVAKQKETQAILPKITTIPVAFETASVLAALAQANDRVEGCSGASLTCLHVSSMTLGIKKIRSLLVFLGNKKRVFSKSEKSRCPFRCNPVL